MSTPPAPVPGDIVSSNGKSFIATFKIEGDTYSFDGTLNPTVPPFQTSGQNATLTYGKIEDLSETRNFKGVLNALSISMKIDPNLSVTITGTLDRNAGYSTITGNGTWSSQ